MYMKKHLKKYLKKYLAAFLCICTLAMTACGGDVTEETADTTAESNNSVNWNDGTETSGGSESFMKDVTIKGNTLDKYMIVTEESTNEAAAMLQRIFKSELALKFVLHIEASQIEDYAGMPYIRIITLPINGCTENIKSTEAKFFEEGGNFKIVLGSRSVSESVAVSYFIDNILKNNKDLTNYSETVELDMIKTLTDETLNANSAAKKILEAANKYTSANVTGSGKCYYVSYSTGSDSNDGLSPEKPWKTIDKVSNTTLPAGSVVLFKRGDIWRFDSYANADKAGFFMLQSNVIYSSYGTGEKPAIYGSPRNAAEVGSWSETGVKNVWKYSEKYGGMSDSSQDDVGNIIFNGGEAYGYKMLKGDTGIEFNGKLSELDSNYEFWYNPSDDFVYLYFDGGNPADVFDSIEMGVRLNLVRASGGKSNIVFDNFTLKYGGAHGITIATSNDITVTNCEIAWLGGGVYNYTADGHSGRYGNGMEINRDSKNIFVDSNYVYQIYDAGLSHQYDSRSSFNATFTCYFENINYTNNVIMNCFYGIEFFTSPALKDNLAFELDGNGNVTSEKRELTNEYPRYMDNINISNNYIMYSGYGWGYWRAASGQPGAAHIKMWENFDQNLVDKNGDGKIIEVKNNKMLISRYDVIYGTFENKDDIPTVSDNIIAQYSSGKAITIEVTSRVAGDKYYKIEKVEVADRKAWSAEEMKAHKHLGNNTYITP